MYLNGVLQVYATPIWKEEVTAKTQCESLLPTLLHCTSLKILTSAPRYVAIVTFERSRPLLTTPRRISQHLQTVLRITTENVSGIDQFKDNNTL